MRKIEIEELKQIQLAILKEVHNFCVKRGLRYSLSGGTLLGAVRHKGYIPWDDDIDIMMPRPDYNILVKEFNGYRSHLICGAYENDKKFMYSIAKIYDDRTILNEEKHIIIGINIDVFPIDGFPETTRETKFFLKKYFLLSEILYLKIIKGYSLKTKFFSYFAKLIPLSLIQKKISNLIKEYDYEKSKFVGAVCGRYLLKEKYPRFVFLDYIELPFENYKFNAIKQYDIYLSQHYGNYMELPPLEKRESHNYKDMFWIE